MEFTKRLLLGYDEILKLIIHVRPWLANLAISNPAKVRLYPRLIEQLQEEVNSYAGWKDTLNQARAEF